MKLAPDPEVRSWHLCDMATCASEVRSQPGSGHGLEAVLHQRQAQARFGIAAALGSRLVRSGRAGDRPDRRRQISVAEALVDVT